MDMKAFSEFKLNKFMVVLGKMQSTIYAELDHHIKELGFNTSEFMVMYSIAAHGPLTIQDIAARIFVTSGNMTYTIDKLEKRAILRRLPCPEDRRKIYIDFTDEGRIKWDSLLEEHSQFLTSLFEGIDEEVLDQTIEQMKIIGKTINK